MIDSVSLKCLSCYSQLKIDPLLLIKRTSFGLILYSRTHLDMMNIASREETRRTTPTTMLANL